MKRSKFPIPSNEDGRLKTLKGYRILDTPPEAAFDRITRLAGEIIDAPMSAITFVDNDRQWFKSVRGMDMDETMRELSFSAYAIMSNDIMTVADARMDPRFKNNTYVRSGPRIIAYAGAPLKTREGHNLGTLCVLDTRPRKFTKKQKKILSDLADLVVDEMELSRANNKILSELISKQEALQDVEAVLGGIERGILFMGADLRVRVINDAFCRIWKIDPQIALKRQTFREICEYIRENGVRATSNEEWQDYIDEREASIIQADGISRATRRADGVLLEYRCIKLPDGGRMLTYLDITERERNDRLRSEFISVASHELRTPLTSLLGALELIDSEKIGQLPTKVKPLLGLAHRNAGRLKTLINDIVLVQKLEENVLNFNFEKIDLVEIINQAISDCEEYGTKSTVAFLLEENIGHAFVRADAERLQQVVANLLSNAVKFSPVESSVTINLSRKDGRVRVTVQDQGPGIAAEMHDRIFEKFGQADSSSTRVNAGTGLGLSISKTIIEHHGSTLGLVSKLGAGAEFYFEIDEFYESSGDIDCSQNTASG